MHIFLSFWKGKNVSHLCGKLLMVSLSWVVVIEHILFLTRRVSFCYICIEVKEWWFDMGYTPPDYSQMKMFISFFVIEVKDSVDSCLYELHQIKLKKNKSYLLTKYVIFSSYVLLFHFCTNLNHFIDHSSQLYRFLTWHILTVLFC